MEHRTMKTTLKAQAVCHSSTARASRNENRNEQERACRSSLHNAPVFAFDCCTGEPIENLADCKSKLRAYERESEHVDSSERSHKRSSKRKSTTPTRPPRSSPADDDDISQVEIAPQRLQRRRSQSDRRRDRICSAERQSRSPTDSLRVAAARRKDTRSLEAPHTSASIDRSTSNALAAFEAQR